MTFRSSAIIAVTLLIAFQAFGAGQPEIAGRAVIDSGHNGPVLGLEYDDKRGLLFSAGDDGTVRIWDAASDTLVRILRVSRLSVTRLAINPADPQVAVVLSNGSGDFLLSVWDWEQEKPLMSIQLKEQPLFLRFSGLGTYLEYGESSWQSLKIIHAADGTPLQFHPEGFGIVGFAEMSRTEKTLMTYQVSGRISYWDMATGQTTLDVPTVPYLTAVRISGDKRYLVGLSGREVLVVDAQNGAVKARAAAPSSASVDIDPGNDEVALAGSALVRFALVGNSLAPRPPSAGSVAVVCYGTSSLFIADPAGGLASISATGQATPFGANVLAAVTGLDAAHGTVALASRDWIRTFSSDMLTGAAAPTYIRTVLARSPFTAATGVAFTDQNRLVAWRADGTAAGLSLLDVGASASSNATPRSIGPGFKAPIIDLRVMQTTLVGVEAGGTVRIVDLATGTSRYETRITGAITAAQPADRQMVVGRTSPSTTERSILRVDMTTGETVSLPARDLITFALVVDPTAAGGPALYSIGIDTKGATNLLLHDGPGFERETVLDSVAEEDLDAQLALDPSTHSLYATLGRDRVDVWENASLRVLSTTGMSTARLVARDNLLYSLNRDSTVSVIDARSGSPVAQIALFSDGEWCVLFADGRYAASPGGDVHVRIFTGDQPVKATEDYRLRIPVQ